MKRPRRIQLRPSWETDDDDAPERPSIEPPTRAHLIFAVAGMLLFWGYWLEWLGPGGAESRDLGFYLFMASQWPLLWRWVRARGRR